MYGNCLIIALILKFKHPNGKIGVVHNHRDFPHFYFERGENRFSFMPINKNISKLHELSYKGVIHLSR